MRINNAYHNKGFTIIELIIVIPIMLIVMAMAFSFSDFGNRYYKVSNIQMNNQDDVRLVGDYIKKNIRSAKIISSNETIVKARNINVNYYALTYINNHLVKQVKRNSDGTLVSQVTIGDVLTGVTYLTTTDNGMLKYQVTDNASGQNYSVVYEVTLDNINTAVLPNANASTIYYANN